MTATRLRPAVLHCPQCGAQHVDKGRWAAFNHKRHLCFACGAFFEVAEPNVGVAGERGAGAERQGPGLHGAPRVG